MVNQEDTITVREIPSTRFLISPNPALKPSCSQDITPYIITPKMKGARS